MSSMTKLMEQAIEKLRSLPEEKQDAVAGFVLSEPEEDQKWEQSSIQHADKRRKLADEAISRGEASVRTGWAS